ncbi:MAG TPA: flagellar assembly protein FliH [Ideonella sp.]|nr:flagellar assembly protein FliH [Ideonella sp.]
MTSSSQKGGPRPVPPPQGGTAKPANYARFIPREELADFAAWMPDAFAGLAGSGGHGLHAAATKAPVAPPPPPPAPPPGPTDEEWQARVLEARQLGYQDGYRDGLEALEAAKRQHAMQISAQMGLLVTAFDEQIQGLEVRMGEAVTDTAVLLARQVLRSELQQRPEMVAEVAREAIGAVMMSARHLRLRLNPLDLDLVKTGAGDALQARDVLLLADAAITRGGCVVESDLGQVDAEIESRWALAAAVFGRTLALEPAAAAPAPSRPKAAEAAAVQPPEPTQDGGQP